MVATDILSFRQGAGRLSLDFVRTLRHRGSTEANEELGDGRALTAWIDQFGPFSTMKKGASDTQARQARKLREAIHELTVSARDAEGVDRKTATLVNRFAAHPVPVPAIDVRRELRWSADDEVAAMLSLIARCSIELATSTSIDRVRECANVDCGALFYDTSRPGSRRWCSMGTCGNNAKKERMKKS